MVVAAILIVLAGLGLAQYRNSVIRAREAVLKEDLFRMRDAIDQYYADKMQYPGTLDALVSDGYMRKLPDDPFTMSSSSWQTVPERARPQQPNGLAGHLRRQERIGSDRARQHEIRGLVVRPGLRRPSDLPEHAADRTQHQDERQQHQRKKPLLSPASRLLKQVQHRRLVADHADEDARP